MPKIGLKPLRLCGQAVRQKTDSGPMPNPVLVVSKDGRNSSISINQDVDLYITRFKEPNTFKFSLMPKRAAWIQTIAGTITVNGQVLKTGDAASVTDVSAIKIEGAPGAEVMLFDLMVANTPP